LSELRGFEIRETIFDLQCGPVENIHMAT
jgi:hypothetical protein